VADELDERIGRLSAAKLALLERRRRRGVGAGDEQAIPRRDGTVLPPLSFAQQRLWFLHQLDPLSSVYNIPRATRLQGALDVEALRKALDALVSRHETLRTTFKLAHGDPVQVIEPIRPLDVRLVDLSARAEVERGAELEREIQAEARRPFDLQTGLMLRALLVRVAPDDHVLLLTFHHIASDAWSAAVFSRELGALYTAFTRGREAALPALPIQYGDYAVWQRQTLQGPTLAALLDYWRAQLAGAPGVLELPTDRSRPPQQDFAGASASIQLTASLREALRGVGRGRDATLFMVLLTAFYVLLHRYTGQTDIVVGTPVAGRTRVELDGLVGFFINTLVLRGDLAGDPTFAECLGRVRERAVGAYAHQDLPFETLVETLQPERALDRSPLCQVFFALQNAPRAELELPGLRVSRLRVSTRTSKFDLSLYVAEMADGLGVTLEYSTALFEATTAERFLAGWRTLLEGVASDPGQRISCLPLLTESERRRIVDDRNRTAAPYPAASSLNGLFEAQVRRAPTTVALVEGPDRVTYDALNRRANRLAHHLRSLGVGPETLVGVCMERSVDLVVALLGILKAGGAYLPLDPVYPAARLAFMLEDARPLAVITHGRAGAVLPPHGAHHVRIAREDPAVAGSVDTDPVGPEYPDGAAYAIYTSGSTGRPKGVLGLHRGAINRAAWMWREYPFAPDEVCCQKTSINFVDSVWEIFGPLLQGVPTVIVPDSVGKDPAALIATLAAERVTRLVLVPALLRALLDTAPDLGQRLPTLRLWVSSGEPLTSDLVERFRMALPGRALLNLYGSSEASADSTAHAVRAGTQGPVPIGRPIANTRVYVLDQGGQVVPEGVPGELYIGGDGLARGYLRRAELTAERFVPDAVSHEPGARLYRTGDLVRWGPDGVIEYLGRLDRQVKIRGHRVELAEIEGVLSRHGAVREAVVVAREDVGGGPRLVAYVVTDGGQRTSLVTDLRSLLRAELPEHMVPSAFVALERLPLLPNGKVDRRGLPPPESEWADADAAFSPPRTPLEELVAGIWAELLRTPRVDVRATFFDLGGHSLQITQILVRIREALGVELPLRVFFESPTVEALAERLEAARGREGGGPAPPIRVVPRDRGIPLSYAQQRLWFLNQLEPASPFYNLARAIRLSGVLEIETLRRALDAAVARHESLRTTIVTVDGSPVQVIAAAVGVALPLIDLGGFAPEAREAEAVRLVAEEARRPFDLAKGPLFRSTLLRLAETDHVLLLTLHHIVSDAWSATILFRELSILYEAFAAGRRSPLAPLPIQYADYAVWQREWLQGDVLEGQLAYWKRQLAGAPGLLALPTDRPRSRVPSDRGQRQSWQAAEGLADAVRGLSRREGVTVFMTLLAAFQALLCLHAKQEDIVVGTPAANRDRAETEGLIGFLVNTLVLRTDLSGDPSFRMVLGRVRDVALGGYAHRDVPFEKVVEAMQPTRASSHNPLFQVWFVVRMGEPVMLEFPGVTVSPMDMSHETVRHDLRLGVVVDSQGLRGAFEYRADLFDPATIARMAAHFDALLGRVVADPDVRLSELRTLLEDVDRRRQATAEQELTEASRRRLRDARRRAVGG
jgi:amino acid adenylation domain-containing protein